MRPNVSKANYTPESKRFWIIQILKNSINLKLPIALFKGLVYYIIHIAMGQILVKQGKNNNIRANVAILDPHNVIIGSDTRINHNTLITGGHDKAKVIIGNKVLIGPNVCFFASNHNYELLDIPIRDQGYYEADIVVEDDVWIGAGCVVTAGVTIGKGSIIGSGSVVTRSIPPYSVAVGSPAKVIKKRV